MINLKENMLEYFKREWPLFFKKLGEESICNLTKTELDYYMKSPIHDWIYTDWYSPLYDIERALKGEIMSESSLFYEGQFDDLKDANTLESQESLLNEMVAGTRMYNSGLNVKFRKRNEKGSDLIWTNERESRELHLEVSSVQYPFEERGKLRNKIGEKRREREKAIKNGQMVAQTWYVYAPFGSKNVSGQVEKVRKIKVEKNQVSESDAGILIVPWTFPLCSGFFEPFYFDRWYLRSGIIYHAFYGHRGDVLYTPDCQVEMLALNDIPEYYIEKVKNNGRFTKDSKFSAAVFFVPTNKKGYYFKNYKANRQLTNYETIKLVSAFNACDQPSKWLDNHKPC